MTSRAIRLFGSKANQPDPGTPLLDVMGRLDRKYHGTPIGLTGTIAYPGSRVTDVAIGDNVYKILNTDLEKSKTSI